MELRNEGMVHSNLYIISILLLNIYAAEPSGLGHRLHPAARGSCPQV